MRYGAQRSSLSSFASAAATIGNSCALVPIASRSLSIASRTLEVPVKDGPRPSLTASTHQRCHRKPWRRRVPKSERRKPSLSLRYLARAQLVENGERRDLPHGGMCPRPVEVQFVLAVHLVELIFGK